MTAQIGRRIYYELNTGNVIVDTGERQGDVVATTEAQDFQNIVALQVYQQSAVGVIQLNFGDNAPNFAQYPFHVDIAQTPPTIVWDTAATTVLATALQQKLAQLHAMYQQTLNAGFPLAIGATTYTFGWADADISRMTATQMSVDKGFRAFPFNYGDINGAPVPIPDQPTFSSIEQRAAQFFSAQHDQVLALAGQAIAAAAATGATVASINAVQWAEATY